MRYCCSAWLLATHNPLHNIKTHRASPACIVHTFDNTYSAILSLSQLFKFDQLFKFLNYSLNSRDIA